MAETPEPLVIDCDTCPVRHPDTCADCLVTFICSRQPDDALVIDVNDFRALGRLAEGGVVPPVRHPGVAHGS